MLVCCGTVPVSLTLLVVTVLLGPSEKRDVSLLVCCGTVPVSQTLLVGTVLLGPSEKRDVSLLWDSSSLTNTSSCDSSSGTV